MQKVYIGIDPGLTGGFTIIYPDSIHVMRTPTIQGKEIDVPAIYDIFDSLRRNNYNVTVIVEDVHSIYGTSAASNFTFGRVLGIAEGIVQAFQFSMIKVQPKKWQKLAFEGISEIRKPGTEGKKGSIDTKAMALIAAKRLYPTVNLLASVRSSKPHEGIIDSLLIAHYGKVNNL